MEARSLSANISGFTITLILFVLFVVMIGYVCEDCVLKDSKPSRKHVCATNIMSATGWWICGGQLFCVSHQFHSSESVWTRDQTSSTMKQCVHLSTLSLVSFCLLSPYLCCFNSKTHLLPQTPLPLLFLPSHAGSHSPLQTNGVCLCGHGGRKPSFLWLQCAED